MKTHNGKIRKLAITAAVLSIMASSVGAGTVAKESTTELLAVNFESRDVEQIEIGDFHFVPGQIGPIHKHKAPAIGYVAKGEIIYQVEGRKPVVLREGDAFYEPVGPRILRFNNASATEEAIFIDVNLEQEGEPFIVFEKELTTHIDRRSLPTIKLNKSIENVNVFVSELEPSGQKKLEGQGTLFGYVSEGVVTVKGNSPERIIAGGSFSLPAGKSTIVSNASSEVPAKVVSFYMN